MILLLLLLSGLGYADNLPAQNAVVIVPVADVWSRPLAPGEKPSDELRETQVLAGERVIIHESSGSWVLIEAVEQPTFRQHNKWEGYPGWVPSINLRQTTIKDKVRETVGEFLPKADLVRITEARIGIPYLWGGLSNKGFDCSGLIHLVYRMDSKVIPRDSHEQWMKAKPIKRADLSPADLIFSAKAANPKTITHVALYAGDGQIIEAPQTGMVVRKVSFKEKYGKPMEEVESGDKVGERVIYFGTFLH